MHEFIVKHKDSNEISQLVSEIKKQGYNIGKDFDFAYSPGRWDYMTGEVPRQTKFTFYNSKLATWFSLKWL
jgi:hypothetical protein